MSFSEFMKRQDELEFIRKILESLTRIYENELIFKRINSSNYEIMIPCVDRFRYFLTIGLGYGNILMSSVTIKAVNPDSASKATSQVAATSAAEVSPDISA